MLLNALTFEWLSFVLTCVVIFCKAKNVSQKSNLVPCTISQHLKKKHFNKKIWNSAVLFLRIKKSKINTLIHEAD